MKIKGITVRIPPIILGVSVFFLSVCAFSFGAEGNPLYLLGLPLCALIIIFPLYMGYRNEKIVLRDAPHFRKNANHVRARQITSSMKGMPVIFEGKIVKVGGLMMNKPTYIIDDGGWQIAVKRFALPDPLVGVGADVEVLGTVYSKVSDEKSVFVNCAEIKPVHKEHTEADESEKIHIKKYN